MRLRRDVKEIRDKRKRVKVTTNKAKGLQYNKIIPYGISSASYTLLRLN